MKKLLLLLPAALMCISAPADDAAPAADPCAKLGWQLAVHAYTFKEYTIFECMDKTAALGFKYMSLSGNVRLDDGTSHKTVELSDKDAKRILDYATAKGLKLVNIGVVQLPPDEEQSRKVFEFAKRMGIDTLVAEPVPEALDTVEKLCKEYNIKVGIHNHPKPSRYWNPDTVLEAVKDRTPLMGSCADTGHWLRSGLEPLECLKKLDGRVIALHFKDLVPDESKPQDGAPTGKKKKKSEAKRMHDVPWGTGVANSAGMMAELKRQNFHGAYCVEYEYHWTNSMPEVAECAKFFNATCAKLAASPSGQ
jgi:sugar phosphate isomerase/epimerase